jgi:hypothetical protein
VRQRVSPHTPGKKCAQQRRCLCSTVSHVGDDEWDDVGQPQAWHVVAQTLTREEQALHAAL